MENRDEKAFVKNDKIALLGCVNGILLYTLVWASLVKLVMMLILGDYYKTFVTEQKSLALLICMCFAIILTTITSVIIAKPESIHNSLKKIKKADIKFMFTSLGAMFAFNLVYNLILITLKVDITGGNTNQMEILDRMTANVPLAFFTMVLLAPGCEEITYRYFLYGGISKYNRKLAIIISGFVFMLVHATFDFQAGVNQVLRELILLPPYMFSGMVLAYAYDKKESLLIPIAIHALNNGFSFILSLI